VLTSSPSVSPRWSRAWALTCSLPHDRPGSWRLGQSGVGLGSGQFRPDNWPDGCGCDGPTRRRLVSAPFETISSTTNPLHLTAWPAQDSVIAASGSIQAEQAQLDQVAETNTLHLLVGCACSVLATLPCRIPGVLGNTRMIVGCVTASSHKEGPQAGAP